MMRQRFSRRGLGSLSTWIVARAAAGVVLMAAVPAFGQSGMAEVIAVQGQTAPGLSGVTLQNLFLSTVSRSGHVVVSSTLAGTGVTAGNDSSLLRFGGGASAVVLAREGQSMLGVGTIVSIGSNAINSAGQVAFVAGFTNTVGGTSDNAGVYVTSNGTGFTQMLRKGLTATGTFTYSSFSGPVLTNSGRVVALAVLAGAGITAANDRAMATSTGGSSATFLREGTSGNGGINEYDRPSEVGQLAILNSSTNAQSGRLYLYSSNGTIDQIVSETDGAPGGNGILNSITSHTVPNNIGQVAFSATLTNTAGGSSDNTGIFIVSSTLAPVQIAREGQAAPGGGTLVDVSGFGFGLSQAGRVAFTANQTNSANGALDGNSIFTGNGGSLTRIARTGQFFDASQTTTLSNLLPEAITSSGAVFFYGFILDAATNALVRDGYFLGDGTEVVEITSPSNALAGSTLTTILGNGGSSRFFDDGRYIGGGILADGRDVVFQFTPSLRYRSSFSSSWDTPSNWTVSLSPDAVHDVRIDPATSLTVTGPAGAVTIKSLQIGGGTGTGTLRLAGGTLTATNGTTLTATGSLTGEGTLAGAVTNSGTIIPTNVVLTGPLTNSGVIRGAVLASVYPTLNASVTNTPTGEVRLIAGETLRITGAQFRNAGRVEALGNAFTVTQLEFDSPVTNVASTGLITARSATVRFDAGLLNQGSLAITSGISDVFGDVSNAVGGSVNVTGGAQVTFYDDVTQNGTLRVAKVGSTTSVAVFLGSFSGAGGFTGGGDVFLEGDLRPGNSPAAVTFGGNASFGSNLASVMEIAGTPLGQYDRIDVTGQLSLGGTLDVAFIDGFAPATGAPMDFILFTAAGGITGDFASITLPDLGGRQWNVFRTPTVFGITTSSVVPEPAGAALVLVPVASMLGRRRRV